METRIGSAEMKLMRALDEAGPSTVRAAHEFYGEPLGLVRTTVQQMMERLRKKNLLDRADTTEGYRYFLTDSGRSHRRGTVHQFVQQSLNGSISPLVSYLLERPNLTPDQRKELFELLESLRAEAE
jgi:predicted transcriptional regulator